MYKSVEQLQQQYLYDPLFNRMVDAMVAGLLRGDMSVDMLTEVFTLAIHKYVIQQLADIKQQYPH